VDLTPIKTEQELVHLRYVGAYGPRANTVLGEMWWGDCAAVEPSKVDDLLESGEWLVLRRGRCKGIMRHSLQRCVQQAKVGSEYCPLHAEDEGSLTERGQV